MTAPHSSSDRQARWHNRAYWLPPGGIGNGLDARTWVVLVDTDASKLTPLLAELRVAGIAAYAAPLDRSGRKISSSEFRIWVDTWLHARAEDVVRIALMRRHW